jgi:hypothetical protein
MMIMHSNLIVHEVCVLCMMYVRLLVVYYLRPLVLIFITNVSILLAQIHHWLLLL